jgi:hypothetical protein
MLLCEQVTISFDNAANWLVAWGNRARQSLR